MKRRAAQQRYSKPPAKCMGNPAMMVDPWGLDDLTYEYSPDFVGPRRLANEGDTRGREWSSQVFENGEWKPNGPSVVVYANQQLPFTQNSLVNIESGPSLSIVQLGLTPWGFAPDLPTLSAAFALTFNPSNFDYMPTYSDLKNDYLAFSGLRETKNKERLEPDPEYPTIDRYERNMDYAAQKFGIGLESYLALKRMNSSPTLISQSRAAALANGQQLLSEGLNTADNFQVTPLLKEVNLARDAHTIVQTAVERGVFRPTSRFTTDPAAQAALANYILQGSIPNDWTPTQIEELVVAGHDLLKKPNKFLPRMRHGKQ